MKHLALAAIVFFVVLSVNAKGDENKTSTEKESTAIIVLSGTVADSGSGELLTGVEVELEGTGQKTYTDFDGNFSFKVKPGDYKVVTKYISYKERAQALELNDKKNHVKIEMDTSR